MSDPTHHPHPAPVRRSLRWLWIGLPVVLALVLCGSGIGIALAVGEKNQKKTQKDAAASTSAPAVGRSPQSEPARTPTAASPTQRGTLTLPARLAGRAKLADDELADVAKNLITLEGDSVGKAVYGVYGRRNRDVLLVRAVEHNDPTFAVSKLTALFEKNIPGLTFSPTPAGPRGGEAACGAVPEETGDAIVCAWADFHSAGAMVFYYTTMANARVDFVTARGQLDRHG